MSKTLKGLLVGAVATEALDRLSILLYEKEKDSTRIRENEARGGLHAYEAAVDRISRRLKMPLQKKDLEVWGWRLHKATGILGGAAYSALRSRRPRVGSGLGMNFGAAFFFAVDEILVPALKLTPGPCAFSWKVHARGAVSHLAYGVAAETCYRLWDRVAARVRERASPPSLGGVEAAV